MQMMTWVPRNGQDWPKTSSPVCVHEWIFIIVKKHVVERCCFDVASFSTPDAGTHP
jgi:hypothetical protein